MSPNGHSGKMRFPKTPHFAAMGTAAARRSLIRRIVSLQERDRRLQHLQARRTPGEPVILMLQRDKVDVFLRAPQRIGHDAALLVRHDRVVTPVDEQHRYIHCIQMFDGRDGIQQRIARP